MPNFIPGVELNRMFFHEAIKPLMEQYFPRLKYSAGLMGEGSDVLGFDTEQSMDHNWGPRGILFVSEQNLKKYSEKIHRLLAQHLPVTFQGFSTNFTRPRQSYLVQQMQPKARGPVNHLVKVFSIRSFFEYYLGFNPYRKVTLKDWLTFPQQALLEVTSGTVYYDGLGRLEEIRNKFSYYPRDIWLYILKIQWDKIANELSYPGRSAQVGDEIGSSLITSRMIDRIMTMCFFLEKKYVPYSKWFGTAFLRLSHAPSMIPVLVGVLHAPSWEERERLLGLAYQQLATLHNQLRITKPLTTELSDFHGRGYKVLDVGLYISEINRSIRDPKLKHMKYPLGCIDQFVDHSRINHLHYVYREFKELIK